MVFKIIYICFIIKSVVFKSEIHSHYYLKCVIYKQYAFSLLQYLKCVIYKQYAFSLLLKNVVFVNNKHFHYYLKLCYSNVNNEDFSIIKNYCIYKQ